MDLITAGENATISRTVYEAFNGFDFDLALEFVDDDAISRVHALNLEFQGREGFREMMSRYKRIAPDGTVEIVRQLEGEAGIATEAKYRGTNTGPVIMPDGTEVPATGRPFEIDFCEVWRIRDGKVVSLDNYTDNVAFMIQLGLMPQPGA